MSRKEEQESGLPWTDGNAWNFKRKLEAAGIREEDCFFTNVFNRSPPGRYHVDAFFTTKKLGVPHLKPLKKGKYLDRAHMHELERLWRQIEGINPNLVIASGDVALWALCTGTSSIDAARGRITEGNAAISGRKVLPMQSHTIVNSDPSAIPVMMFDLDKAARECAFPEMRRPARTIYIPETREELDAIYNRIIRGKPSCSSDIENKGDIITCVSFSCNPSSALVIPFYCESKPTGNYWDNPRDEFYAWRMVELILTTNPRMCGQNYQYDMQHEWRTMHIPNPQFTDDTMLLHHVLQIEMRKGLGFLASLYTDEIQWKGMHHHSADKTVKQGENE